METHGRAALDGIFDPDEMAVELAALQPEFAEHKDVMGIVAGIMGQVIAELKEDGDLSKQDMLELLAYLAKEALDGVSIQDLFGKAKDFILNLFGK